MKAIWEGEEVLIPLEPRWEVYAYYAYYFGYEMGCPLTAEGLWVYRSGVDTGVAPTKGHPYYISSGRYTKVPIPPPWVLEAFNAYQGGKR